ncbi:DNA (cytosine-5)-methyltransferase 1 [Enterococcus sp. DIV0609]|jgi:DNA (cytosine-5)-methyltransferase 1|uniref:DNA (cytosine-5-)-methyltransferase n=1 Tax=Enterococcus TaxID=1350 RepID=UPI0004511CE1|nr:DNA (cytosine-5-)-methyltransferase [Enterococcus faecalis]EGO9794979.1 DNA (cytosine-5-)-methyltransferase [Enterococcus faecalis]EIB6818651.1 DNA (cytosine-5-)-methyltransferase [Enterococcus faecalis]EKA3598251.1 DNA (cytosine-5-)-methyltransferase [Enterococcus faecalis]ETU56602.1 hypothetical protein P024_02263 [Enterococcus faecalis EnGen0424]NSM29500.1 DNA (cytosine-5-)-methyltransferase [Enterococcus faecalis]
MTLKMIDLCAGIGGIRRGFELTGRFTNVCSAEIDPFAIKTYKHIFNEDPTGDVTSREFKNKLLSEEFDVLLAGFPCQSFSRAGQQKGFLDSTRGTIFFDIAEIIKENKPSVFLLENVDNLFSHDKGNTISTIMEVLVHELNYSIIGVHEDDYGNLTWERNQFIRNSRNFGVPQNRPRVYIVGFSNEKFGKDALLETLEELPNGRNDLNLYNDLNDLLEVNAPAKYYLAEGMLNTLENHKKRHSTKGNGFGFMVVNDPARKRPLISNAVLATGGSGKERNLVIDSTEFAGQIVSNKHTPINNKGVRNMTPKEWGKLQGFINYAFVDNSGVDHFEFPDNLSDTQKYKQFGNAVTIPVIESIAQHIIKMLQALGEID